MGPLPDYDLRPVLFLAGVGLVAVVALTGWLAWHLVVAVVQYVGA